MLVSDISIYTYLPLLCSLEIIKNQKPCIKYEKILTKCIIHLNFINIEQNVI